MTDSHKIIPCSGQRGQKPYSVQRHILVLYRLYKRVLINPGEEPSKTIFRSSRISVLGIPTGPTKGYQPKLLRLRHTTHKVSFVEVTCVAGAWKYLGSRKTGLARGLLGRRPSPLARPVFSCAHYFQAPATQAMLR